MKFFTHKTSLPISLMYFSRVSGCYPYTSKIRKSNIHLLHLWQSSSKKPLASNWQKTENGLTFCGIPGPFNRWSPWRFYWDSLLKMNRFFFHWASWVGDPPTPEHTSTTCATCRASPLNIPNFHGSKVGHLGGFHQPSPPLGGREQKFTQHLENWILILLDFHWFFFF